MLTCPECQSPLPSVRQQTPWCECGWSSVPDEQLKLAPTDKIKRKIEQDRKRARLLAKIDLRLLEWLEHPVGRLLWRLYTLVTLLLCLPFQLAQAIAWGGTLVLLGIGIAHQARGLIFVALSLLGGMGLYTVLTRFRAEPLHLPLNRDQAPDLFAMIDQVAAQVNTAPPHRVFLFLDSNAAIHQKWVWRPRPMLERRMDLGLLLFEALNVPQMKAVLAHEMAHYAGLDAWLTTLFSGTLEGLSTLIAFLSSAHLLGLLASIPLRLYRRLLLWFGFQAIRHQEYMADRRAAEICGPLTVFQGLLHTVAVSIAFHEYLPAMRDMFSSGADRHDFYHQFKEYWTNIQPKNREAIYARAVASFGSVYATHPTYRDRVRALRGLPEPETGGQEAQAAHTLLPNMAEMGRELTIQLLRRWLKHGYMVQ